MEVMTKDDLIVAVAQRTGLTKARAAKVVEIILGAITEAMAAGEDVRIAGLGTFTVATPAARTGRNPRTGAPIRIAARRTPRFRPTRALKEAVNLGKPFEAFRREETMAAAGDAAVEPVADEVMVPVHYATDRKATGATAPNDFYGAEYAESLYYGLLTVSIPRRHEIGRIERPTVWSLWREDPADHVVLRRIDVLDEAAFFSSLAAEVARLDRKTAFVFVHGFNVTFAEAAWRAAQMAYDLFLVGEERNVAALSAAPILYSWPSWGDAVRYTHDYNNATASVGHFQSFLKDVAARSGAEEITVIAHSMGNQVLVGALERIGLAMQPDDDPLVREIVLAAADVDQRVYRQAAAVVRRTGRRMTLYASDRDRALKLSIKANGFARAGDATGGIVIVNDVDSIDASAVGEDILAHSYVGEPDLLVDLHDLMTSDKAPADRFGMLTVGAPPSRFWRMRPRA